MKVRFSNLEFEISKYTAPPSPFLVVVVQLMKVELIKLKLDIK